MIENVTAAKCLEFAIQTEEIGAELYQALAKKFASDRELTELFEGLGRDEVQHGELVRALHGRVIPRVRDQAVPPEQQDYLRAMAMSEFFSGGKALATDLEGIRSREDALERTLNLEKATLAFYQAVRDVVGADDVIDSLIAVEKRHVVKSLKDRLRHKYNVSVAEIDYLDQWQRALLSVVTEFTRLVCSPNIPLVFRLAQAFALPGGTPA